jgi:hypothetical protein
VFDTGVGWSPIGVDRLAVTVAMIRCGFPSCSPDLDVVQLTDRAHVRRTDTIGSLNMGGKNKIVTILSYNRPGGKYGVNKDRIFL